MFHTEKSDRLANKRVRILGGEATSQPQPDMKNGGAETNPRPR